MANRFVYLADSLEDLPTRKEVARRTVFVEVARVMGTQVNLGALHAEVLGHSADIIASLKRMVESHPAEWYLQHENVGLRPVGRWRLPTCLPSISLKLRAAISTICSTPSFSTLLALTWPTRAK